MLRRGFTLIELLIVMLLTSIVVLASYALMTGTASTFKNEDARKVLEANLRNAELLIQRDITRIAYRAGFDSISDGTRIADTAAPNILAFQHARIKLDGNDYSEFTIVGDVTDYEGFEIDALNGTVLSFSNTLTMPPTSFELYAIENTAPAHHSASDEQFNEAFMRAFANVHAIRLTSSENQSVIVSVASVDPVTRTIRLKESFNPDPSLGFSTTNRLSGDMVTPIIAISYTVSLIDGVPCLMRCTNHPFTRNAPSNCQELIRNIGYFDVLPNYTTIPANQISNALAVAPGGTLAWVSAPPTIDTLTGLVFRVSIIGEQMVRDLEVSEAQVDAFNQPPFWLDAKGDVFPYVHLTGSALIHSRWLGGASVGRSIQVSNAVGLHP